MDKLQLYEKLDEEWDRSNGFLGKLRTGVYDGEGYQRLLFLLQTIRTEDNPYLEKRLVELIWFIPLFMTWQRERIQQRGFDIKELDAAIDKITDLLLLHVLGNP